MFLIQKKSKGRIVPVQIEVIDIDAHKSKCPQESLSSKTLPKMKNIFPVLIYVIIVAISVCAMIVPIFIQYTRLQNISNSGIVGVAIRTSTRLMIMESMSIGCTLPMLSDNLLDRFTDKNTKLTLSMWHRNLFLFTCSISGFLYLCLSDYYFMPYLYIVLIRTKVLLVGAITSYAVLSGTIMKSLKMKLMFFTPVPIVALSFVLEVYTLLFPENHFLSILSTVFYYLAMITFFAVQFPWFYLLWRRYQVNKTLNNEEKKEFVYMLAMLFYAIAAQLVNVIFGYPDSWLATGDNLLIGYIVAQVVCILLATVLPTRFMRKVVQVRTSYISFIYIFLQLYVCMYV